MAERKNSAGMLVAAGIVTVAGTSFMLGASVASILIAPEDGAGVQRIEAIAAPYITPKPSALPAIAPVRAEGAAPATDAQVAAAIDVAGDDDPALEPAADVGTKSRPADDGSAAMVAGLSTSDAATDAGTGAGDADPEAAPGASPAGAAEPAGAPQPRAEAALAALTPDRYLVQVGAFIDKLSAERLVDRLDAKFAPDCPASVEQRPGRPGRVWWIVTLCPQPDLSAAGEMAGRVARSLDIRPMVRRAGAAP